VNSEWETTLRKHHLGTYLEELGKIAGNFSSYTETYGIRNTDTNHSTAMLDHIPSNEKQICLWTE